MELSETIKIEEKNQVKKPDVFNIFSLNTDCGYILVPHGQGDTNMYPCNLCFEQN